MQLSGEAQAEAPILTASPASPKLGRGLVARFIRGIAAGRLTIILPSGEQIERIGELPGYNAILELRSAAALRRILARGDIGFAEGYIAGDWTSPDLTSLVALAADNVARLDRTLEGFWPVRLWRVLTHQLRQNSMKGSRRNIAFHYDLGNDFYRLWLDRSMTYSSAIALPRGETLEQAQAAKLDHIINLMALTGEEDVLEIGCGWGALATRIAADSRRVTGLTLSREQLAEGQSVVAAAGVADRVNLRLRDYRDETGRYDRIVSIEMLEAVGEAYWPVYFERLRACLKPGGRIVLQAITIRDDRFKAYKRSPDFIQQYIFPGGMLPTPGILHDEARKAGLKVISARTFGEGYADTLAEWRRRFGAAWPEIAALGFKSDFRRLWDYYLSYCEGGFRSGTIDVGLYVLVHAA